MFFFDWFLVGAPTNNYGDLSPYNFGVIGIIISSGLVNFFCCVFLSSKLNKYKINLPKTNLIKKIVLILLASLITSTIFYLIIKDFDGLSSKIWDLFILIIGFLAFSIIYFLITKLFGVNKLNLSIKL